MKKVLLLLAALALLCISAQASQVDAVTDFVVSTLQYTPYQSEQAAKQNALNFIVDNDSQAVVTWTDAELGRVYAINGGVDTLAAAYSDMLPLLAWDSCALFIDQEPVAAYGSNVDANNTFDSLESYAVFVTGYFGVDAAEITDDAQAYVLNTNTKKFHYPDCSSVNQIKAKNRKDYTGSRDDLIAQGYAPCGKCNP